MCMKSEYVQTTQEQCQSSNDFIVSFVYLRSCDLLTVICLSLMASFPACIWLIFLCAVVSS